MPYTVTAKNLMLSQLASVAVWVSLHTDEPDADGSNEVSGGSPAYARKAITWGEPANGNVDSTNQPVFDVPAGTTVSHVGFWSAQTNGTFYGYGDVIPETFGSQGTYTLLDSDLDLNT